MKIAIASDHAGFELKERLRETFKGVTWIDGGPSNDQSVDYPDYAATVCKQVTSNAADRGLLICGSGIGMSIAANKFQGIRAALCHNAEFAMLSREHNDANVLCLPGRYLTLEQASEILKTWIDTPFSKAPRHMGRIQKLSALENT